MNLPINSSKLQWTAQDGSPPTTCQTTARPLTNGLSYWSVVCDWGLSLDSYTQNLSENWRYTTNGASTEWRPMLLGVVWVSSWKHRGLDTNTKSQPTPLDDGASIDPRGVDLPPSFEAVLGQFWQVLPRCWGPLLGPLVGNRWGCTRTLNP